MVFWRSESSLSSDPLTQRTADGTYGRRRRGISRFSRFLGRIGLLRATALLVIIAVVGATVMFRLIGMAMGLAVDRYYLLAAALVTIAVATPIVVYALDLVRSVRA